MRFTIDTDDSASLEVSLAHPGVYKLGITCRETDSVEAVYLSVEEVKKLRYALILALQEGGDK